MREHEKRMKPEEMKLKEVSEQAYTAFLQDEILCCYGITKEGALWQIPSKGLFENKMAYAREAKREILKLAKSKCWTLCQKDALHTRWMMFLGFKMTGEISGLNRWEYGT